MFRNNSKYILQAVIVLVSISCKTGESARKTYLDQTPEQKEITVRNGGVACIHPLASQVGLYILEKGGNAVDAAIAMQFALAVVYPQAGNLGGGGFMVMRLADGTTRALDFRETAPASAYRDMYLDSNGKLDQSKSLAGHHASGVPGTVAGIFESLKYARLPLRTLIEPAIELAGKGYSYRLDIGFADPKINTMPNVFDGRRKWKRGDTLVQMDLANTLKRIRDHGRDDFYQGLTAKLIVDEMVRGGGNITLRDLKDYKAVWRAPHQFTYRGYDIVSMPLPSSGGILLHQMLKMVEPFPVSSYGRGSTATIGLMVEAERRAYRDRATYMGDADFVDVPVEKITSDVYLKEQMKDFIAGVAGKSTESELKIPYESKQTTHLSVLDKDGNAVAVTTTLNMPFGSGVVVGGAGFFLNNEMNDFNVKTGSHNASGGVGGKQNSIEPHKRMLSSMTPTIVIKDGQLFMVLGTPGGTTIPTSVFQAIVNVIDFHMTGSEAVNFPKFHHEWLPDVVAMDNRVPKDTINLLKRSGYTIISGGLSFLELIKVNNPGSKEIVSEHGSVLGY